MLQKYLDELKKEFRFNENSVILHNALTSEDIYELSKESVKKNVKRNRPDMTYNYSVDHTIKFALQAVKDFKNCPEVSLESWCVHLMPAKSKFAIDSPADMYLDFQSKTHSTNEIKCSLFDFRLKKLSMSNTCSKDILNEQTNEQKNLLQQSMTINCLCGNIKGKPELFKRNARFESNFPSSSTVCSSLRNRTISLYLKQDFRTLISFFKKYFPDLSDESIQQHDLQSSVPCCKKAKINSSKIHEVVVTKNDLQNHFTVPINSDVNIDIFQQFCCGLVENGLFKIQSYSETGWLVCCMNDYGDTDASFKYNDFVYTARLPQEQGDYFYCSCSVFSTLINLKNCDQAVNEFVVSDLSGENCVTCLHCKFIKKIVIPTLRSGNVETKIDQFIAGALNYEGKDVIELSRFRDTHKFSVKIESEDMPSFVNFTFSQRINKYIVSCMNGKCRSLRGHKKVINNLCNSDVCKHIDVIKNHPELWEDLINDQYSVNLDIELDNETSEETDISNDSSFENCFDSNSGLWKFKCRSSHSPAKRDCKILKSNVLTRDRWNDDNLERLGDGSLKGPALYPDIPDNTCSCRAGWIKQENDVEFCENGLKCSDKIRHLTIFTQLAPVKCQIFDRKCYNSENPCKILWDEGKSLNVHVYSRDTAAGDEIGWEFVSMVINSGITFSSYCQLKTELYKLRNIDAKFMSPKVFVNWWFSWASSMNIDFRQPCDVCGFEPKRLCCDGTRVGVGFRHAKYEEINETETDSPIYPTLHRRMDRCFLKTMNGIDKQQMIANRKFLDYLARKELSEIDVNDTLEWNDMNLRLIALKSVLPLEVLTSFERFFSMSRPEKVAYARVLKMLSTTASVTSLLPPLFCAKLQEFVQNPVTDGIEAKLIMNSMRSYAPEIKDLICESMNCHNGYLPFDIRLFIQYILKECLSINYVEPAPASPQPDTYNPAKFGRAYYFNKNGLKLRTIRQFSIDNENTVRRNVDHDDGTLDFEKCQKLFSKSQNSAKGTSNLFLWFCADHGHCYGFHMTGAEGRKDPAASLYSYLENPPKDIFYDFACNLQEYCLNRESGYFKNVRFFHDIFHGYSHKCSRAFSSSRLQGFESVNSEICEQFNSFIQCIKKSGRQMSQIHFCFYLQFFLHEWNERKRILYNKKLRIAMAGLV
ncbi:hypothetical protein ACF0H5_012236 [Mactra antiquata]